MSRRRLSVPILEFTRNANYPKRGLGYRPAFFGSFFTCLAIFVLILS